MHLIEVSARFYARDQDAPLRLMNALGEDGTVEYGADTHIATAQQRWTREGEPLEHLREAIDHFANIAKAAGLETGRDGPTEDEGLFEFDVHVEELIAIGGNHHTRGDLVFDRLMSMGP